VGLERSCGRRVIAVRQSGGLLTRASAVAATREEKENDTTANERADDNAANRTTAESTATAAGVAVRYARRQRRCNRRCCTGAEVRGEGGDIKVIERI